MFLVPIAAPSVYNQGLGPAASAVAMAGHYGLGGWCECGTQECICDPGELPATRTALTKPAVAPGSSNVRSKLTVQLVAFELLRWIVSRF